MIDKTRNSRSRIVVFPVANVVEEGLRPRLDTRRYQRARRDLGKRVFKGGTCLKKCYFETYRFSEDLDFTLRNEGHIDDEFLRPVFEEVIGWVSEQSGLNIPADQIEFDIYENPRELTDLLIVDRRGRTRRLDRNADLLQRLGARQRTVRRNRAWAFFCL
jgi:hypothetical protein